MCSSITRREDPIISVHFGIQTYISIDHGHSSISLLELTEQIAHSLQESHLANDPSVISGN